MAATKTKPVFTPARAPVRSRAVIPGWLHAGSLALLVLVLYWPVLQCRFVNYDDDRYVTANPQVQQGLTLENLGWAFAHPVADNWHPLTVISHMLACQIFALNPWGHHLLNLLLHAGNAALVFIWLRRLTGAVWRSFFVAALFAVHPLRVESVAWIAERKDVLSGCFGLMGLLAYTRYAQSQKGRGPSFLRSGHYWLACLWLAMGLMSKPMLVTWPFVMLLLDYWPLERFKSTNVTQLLLEKVPLLLLAVAGSIVTFVVQNQGAATGMIQDLSLSARFENAAVACCRYLGKTAWPVDLAVLYPHAGHWPVAQVGLATFLLAAVTVTVVVLRRQYPFLLLGWFWFLGTLIPVIGLVQVGFQSMADRYTYLPSLGILITLVWGVVALGQRQHWPALPGFIVGAACVLAGFIVTRAQLAYWHDGETLFRHTIQVTRDNYLAQYNLGVALDDLGRPAEAIAEYQSILQSHPDYASAHINLALDLDAAGQSDDALEHSLEAVRLAPNNALAQNNAGMILFEKGRNGEAIQHYREASRLEPDNASAHNGLAAALYNDGQHEAAIQEFETALRLRPDFAQAHYNYACVLEKQGQTAEAIKHFQAVLRLQPDYSEAREQLEKLSPAK